jgi:hypothetical protein
MHSRLVGRPPLPLPSIGCLGFMIATQSFGRMWDRLTLAFRNGGQGNR